MGILRRSALPFGGTILFVVMSFALLAFRESPLDINAIVMGIAILCLIIAQYIIVPVYFKGLSKTLLVCVNMLCCISLVMLYRLDPTLGIRQLIWYGIGLICMVGIMSVVIYMDAPEGALWIFMGAGVGLLVLSLIFGSVIGGAQNWIKFESIGLSIQPSEFAKIALVFALAAVFREKRHFFGYMNAFIFTALCIIILVIIKDLGAALMYFFVFLIMLYAATSSTLLSITALGAFSGAAFISYKIFAHVQTRVAIWQNPWATPDTGGYQIVQGLISMVSGGPFGTGLALGSPRYVPAYSTDYIFTAICEEMGTIMGLLIIVFYILITIIGFKVASRAENKFFALLALGSSSAIALQAFIILGGIVKLIPLTGITLPFMSYGGSSMLVSLMFIGAIQAVSIRSEPDEIDVEEDDLT